MLGSIRGVSSGTSEKLKLAIEPKCCGEYSSCGQYESVASHTEGTKDPVVAEYLCCQGCGYDAEDHSTGTRYLLALWVCHSCREGAEVYPRPY